MHHILMYMVNFEPIKKIYLQMPRYILRLGSPRQTEFDDVCSTLQLWNRGQRMIPTADLGVTWFLLMNAEAQIGH